MRSSNPVPPNRAATDSASSGPWAMACSSSERPSRMDPAAGTRDHLEGGGVDGDLLARAHLGEVTGELLQGVESEFEVLRARPDGGQHAFGTGGGQHEHHVLGRLLEGLEQRVRCVGREHVHLVDEVHLVPGCEPQPEVHALRERADVVDAVVRRRVELEQIEETTLGDADAVLAQRRTRRRRASGRGSSAPWPGCARSWSCRCRGGRRRGRRGRHGRRAPRCAARCSRGAGRRAHRTAAAGTCGRATGRPFLLVDSAPLRSAPSPSAPTVATAHRSRPRRSRTLYACPVPRPPEVWSCSNGSRHDVPPATVGTGGLDHPALRRLRTLRRDRRCVQDRVQAARHREPGGVRPARALQLPRSSDPGPARVPRRAGRRRPARCRSRSRPCSRRSTRTSPTSRWSAPTAPTANARSAATTSRTPS